MSAAPVELEARPGHRLRLEVSTGTMAKPVLERVVTLFAARTGLAVDRLSEIVLALDALRERAPELVAADRLGLDLRIEPGCVDVGVGPLLAEPARRLLAEHELPAAGAVIAGTADEARLRDTTSREARLDLRFEGVAAAVPAPEPAG